MGWVPGEGGKMKKIIFVVFLVGILGGSSFVFSQSSKYISMDFRNADIRDVFRGISAKAGLNIIVSPEVEGKVTLRFEKPVPLFKALELILEINDCEYEKVGNIIKIRKKPILSRSFPLKYGVASEFVELVHPLLSERGKVKAVSTGNTLLVSDMEKYLKQIEKTVLEADVPEKQLDTQIFTLKYALAEDVLPEIEESLSSLGKAKISPSTNSIIITETKYKLSLLKDLVKSLDLYAPKKEVFVLRYAVASSIVSDVKRLLTDRGKVEVNQKENSLIVTDLERNISQVRKFLEEQDLLTRQLVTKVFPLKYARIEEISSTVKGALSEKGKLRVDSSTNTLIITDSAFKIFELEKIIKNLDVFKPRREVFTLKYALAEEVASGARVYLSDKGRIEVDREGNKLILTATPYNMERIKDYLAQVDRAERQLVTRSFSLKYAELDKVIQGVKEKLSSYGDLKVNREIQTLTLTDTAYNLTRVEKFIKEMDIYVPERKSFPLIYASAEEVAKLVKDRLSEKGKVEVKKDTSTLILTDVRKYIESVTPLVEKTDTLQEQLKEKRFSLKEIQVFMTEEEIKKALREVITEYGKVSVDKNKGICVVKDLKRNFPEVEKRWAKLTSPELKDEVVTYRFTIQHTRLDERTVALIANVLGINPEDVYGLYGYGYEGREGRGREGRFGFFGFGTEREGEGGLFGGLGGFGRGLSGWQRRR